MGLGKKLKAFFSSSGVSNTDTAGQDNTTERLLENIVKESNEGRKTTYWYNITLSKLPSYILLQEKSLEEKRTIAFYLTKRIDDLQRNNSKKKNRNYGHIDYLKKDAYLDFLKGILRRDLNFSDQELFDLLLAFKASDDKARIGFSKWPVTYVVQQIERKAKKKSLSIEMKLHLKEVLSWRQMNQTKGYWGSDIEKVKVKVQKMVFEAENLDGGVAPYELPEDGFGTYVNPYMKTLTPALKDQMYSLFYLFLKASASKPSKAFLQKTNAIIDDIGISTYKKTIHNFLEYLVKLKVIDITHSNGWVSHEFLKEKNNVLVKGMVWSLAKFHDTKTLHLVAQVAERSFKKIPGVGQTAAAVGNACVYVLGNTKGLEGISQLSRLKLKVKQSSTRSLIEKYLDSASDKMGISTSEIEEISIPDFGLTLGKRIEYFDDYKFEIEIEDIGKVKNVWIKPDGKLQKSIPSFVKETAKHNLKLKKVKADIAKIKKYLTAQRDRIDRVYLDNRLWNYEALEKNYIHHGLVSFIARTLIWEVKKGDTWIALYYNQEVWYDSNDIAQTIKPENQFRLWHPCNAKIDDVLMWRNKLEELEVKQTLKQVYREVYILTDAEINTKSYSNRMAAHLLKQHQFNALAALRGWKYSLLGAFDNGIHGDMASIQIKAYKMQAQFWINELNAEDAMNDTGIWLYIATDQVRFINLEGEPIDLVDIPPIVFSEIMRNVDLFVGVSSVGNDPEWRDNGGIPQYRDYWTSYSFGDLNEIAKTRKTILERLLPRLKINQVAKIEGKFLVVEGTIRTYKIHIGSTNILMEPNDEYLCIVPDRSISKTPSNVFLPFEGDRGLSLILSKAFLLAEDKKVTDKTILSQIHRK